MLKRLLKQELQQLLGWQYSFTYILMYETSKKINKAGMYMYKINKAGMYIAKQCKESE